MASYIAQRAGRRLGDVDIPAIDTLDSRLTAAEAAIVTLQTYGRAPDVIIEDQKSLGTAGGTATSGSFFTRTLNTLVRNQGTLASLATNQFTLPAGSYYIQWSSPAWAVNAFQTILYNATAAAGIAAGTSEFATSVGGGGYNHSRGSVTVTVAATTAFEIQMRVESTFATSGQGRAASFSTEVYTRVEITRTA
jgi:hypothetical protein